jgi:hypothetical protein
MRLMGCSVSLFEFGNTQVCRQMNAWGEWTEYKSDRNADRNTAVRGAMMHDD